MFQRRPDKARRLKVLGIALLAIGLLRLPLPQADYHQIRHQHGPGEICVHHDHLLRWHPEAGETQAVAVLHWHWFAPSAERPDRDDDEADAPSRGPALHAHADGLEPDVLADLVIQADLRGRCVPPSTHAPSPLETPADVAASFEPIPPGSPPRGGPRTAMLARAPVPPSALMPRLNC